MVFLDLRYAPYSYSILGQNPWFDFSRKYTYAIVSVLVGYAPQLSTNIFMYPFPLLQRVSNLILHMYKLCQIEHFLAILWSLFPFHTFGLIGIFCLHQPSTQCLDVTTIGTFLSIWIRYSFSSLVRAIEVFGLVPCLRVIIQPLLLKGRFNTSLLVRK